MLRLRLCVLFAVIALPAAAQHVFNVRTDAKVRTNATNCTFIIAPFPDSLSCATDLDRGVPSICTTKYLNTGTDPCTGHFIGAIGPVTQGTVDQASTTGI